MSVIEGGMKTIQHAYPTIFLLQYHAAQGEFEILLRSLGYIFYNAETFAQIEKLAYNNILVHRDRQAVFTAGGARRPS